MRRLHWHNRVRHATVTNSRVDFLGFGHRNRSQTSSLHPKIARQLLAEAREIA